MTFLGFMLTLLAGLALFATVHAVLRLFPAGRAAENFVAALVIAAAELVLVAELLSLLHGFSWSWGLIFLMIAAIGSVAWSHRCRPYAAPELRAAARVPLGSARRIWGEVDGRATFVSAGALLVVVLLAELIAAVAVAPNGFDALAYHLTRAAYWIQFHSVAWFFGATERQAAFPINGEVLQAWAMMLAHGDRTVQLVQWTCGLGAVAAVYVIARRLGQPVNRAFIAGTVAAGFPIVVGEASSAQNDLIFAFFTIAAVLFLIPAIRAKSLLHSILFATSLALAIGTKSVALPMLPAFIVAGAVLAGREWRRLTPPVTAAIVAVILLSSFNYAQNVWHTGSLTASPGSDELRVHSATELPKNFARISWLATFDMPSDRFSWIDDSVNSVGTHLFGWTTSPPDSVFYQVFSPTMGHSRVEDKVGIGLLGLVLLIAVLLALARPGRREAFALACFATVGFFAIVATLRSNIWIARFLMPCAFAAAPLTAALMRRGIVRALIVLLVACSALPMAFGGQLKSFSNPDLISATRTVQMGAQLPGFAGKIRELDQVLPEDGRVGFVGTQDAQEYVLFGPHLRRTVVKLTPFDLDANVLGTLDLDAVVIADSQYFELAKSLGARYVGEDDAATYPQMMILERRPSGLVSGP
ncbi:MAG: glycosyltransferase family 39 protein [Solirubrobacterales bacterium]